ncbi:MAG: efflux RND transporter periplasmic adaptor subunit [Parachlamydiales bacterium]|nr:efflux RND transporter periplasmic adaptor subunit [Parachlamydiales bacterium]
MKILLKSFVCLFLAISVFSCKKEKKEDKKYIKVKTELVEKKQFEKSINLTGEIEAVNSVDVFANIPSKLLSYQFEDGKKTSENTYVEKDQIFAYLDNDDLKIALDQAKTNVLATESNLQIATIGFNNSEKDLNRQKSLFEKGAITEKQKELAESDFERQSAILNQANANLENAKLVVKKMQKNFDDSFVKSPISGVIAKRYVSENNLAHPTSPIAKIVDINNLKIILGIPDKILSNINEKTTKVEVKIDSVGDKIFETSIYKIYPTIDPQTRMATIELRLKNENNLIKPGSFAKVNLIFSKDEKTIKVPFSSLIYHSGSYQAFIFKDNKAYLKKLKIGDRSDDYVEILEGLNEGDQLIIMGQKKVTDQIDVKTITDLEEKF